MSRGRSFRRPSYQRIALFSLVDLGLIFNQEKLLLNPC
jgi:hypothetical protein